MGTIYLVQSKSDGMIYVGQTVHPKGVVGRYGGNLNRPAINHNIRPIDEAFIARGGRDFIFQDLMTVGEEDRNFWEKFWIKALDAQNPEVGFNLDSGGCSDKRLSEASKLKISISKTGKPQPREAVERRRQAMLGHGCSEETRRKIGLANKGKTRSEEARRRISLGHRGKKLSEEHKHRISEAGKGRKHTPESIAKMRVVQKDKSEETRRKISLALTGIKQSSETVEKRRLAVSGLNHYTKRKLKNEIYASDVA